MSNGFLTVAAGLLAGVLTTGGTLGAVMPYVEDPVAAMLLAVGASAMGFVLGMFVALPVAASLARKRRSW